jgi:hypothetical protein
MIELLENLNTIEKKYFNEKYISKKIKIPYLENENYRYWFMQKNINNNSLKSIHEYIDDDLNVKMKKISKTIKKYTSELNSFFSFSYKASLHYTYYRYKKKIKKSEFHNVLSSSKDLSLEDKRIFRNKLNNNSKLYSGFFEPEIIFRNIINLFSNTFGINIVYNEDDFKKDSFNIYVCEKDKCKKINIKIISNILNHNNVSHFNPIDSEHDFLGEIFIYKDFDIGNSDKLDINAILTFAHELGHALESALSKKYSDVKESLECSTEAISLLCELIATKNMNLIIEKKLTILEIDRLNHGWDYDVFFESLYCINMLNGSFSKNNFKCNNFQKTYEYDLTQSMRSSFLSLYDFRDKEDDDEESLGDSFYEFNIYLHGHLLAEELYLNFFK